MLLLTSFTSDKTNLDYYAQGQMLRSLYLFSEHLLVTGTGHFEIAFEEHNTTPTPNLKKAMIRMYAEEVPDPAFKEAIERAFESLKHARKTVKHESSAMIIARKRIEKSIDLFYETSINWLKQLLDIAGFMGLMSLVNEGEIYLVGSNDEHPTGKYEKGTTFSSMLTQKWLEDEDEIYCFTTPFWEYANEHQGLLTTVEEMNQEARVILFALPSLPKLQSYTTGELKLLKKDIFNSTGAWKTTIENWSLQLRKEDFSAERFSEYASHFASELKPFMEQLEEKIKASELLQKPQSTKGLQYSENYLAVTNARTAWDIMEWGGLVPKESMHIFEQNLPEGCTGDKAVLLFLSKSYSNPMVEEEDLGDKKSLQL